jgi:CheY-like chemotaxis protein
MRYILVVDDNPVNAKLAGFLLEAAGYGVLVAENADEAMIRIAQQRPDLILMDLQLPGTDGLTLTRQLKADPRFALIPIVALTASAMKGDEEKALQAGCDGYLAKPLDTRAFARQIGDILRDTRR